MSKIADLIKKMCPGGVQYKTLNEVTKWDRKFKGVENNVSKKKFKHISASELKSLASNVKEIKLLSTGLFEGYTSEKNVKELINDDEVITFPSGGSANIKYFHGKFIDSGNIIGISYDPSIVNLKFIYFNLLNQLDTIKAFYRGSGVKHPDMGKILKIKIPIPPIEVQNEIVKILNKFIELETKLKEELEVRKLQYDYWKEKIYNNSEKYELKPLIDLFPFIRNGFVGTVTPYFTTKEKGIRYLEGTNIHNGRISDNEILYVTYEFHKKHEKNELKNDDIVMVQSGHIGECAVVGDKYKGSNCHALIIMSNGGKCLSKYIVYYFHTLRGFNSLTPAITGGTIKHILAGKIGKIKVPCPPLEEQRKIINILDEFDVLINDYLPNEIEIRKKQHEYYMGKLLNFNEVVSHE